MKLSISQITGTTLFKENVKAAVNNPGKRTEKECIADALVGSAAEISAIALLGKDEIKKNEHPDIRMVYAYDLEDDFYRYEVKSISAGEYATFHTATGTYSSNGIAGFSLTSMLRYSKADWLLIMKYEYQDDGIHSTFEHKPHLMIWVPSIHKYIIKSKRVGGGYYFDHRGGTVENEFLVGDDICKYLKKISGQ